MKILLVGEYSRLHNSLKEGLHQLGHEVTIMGNKDDFKNYPVDIYINHSFQKGFLKKIKIGIYKFTSLDLGSIEIYFKAKFQLKKLEHFDIVQLINESPLLIEASFEKRFIKKLIKQSDTLFVLSTGSDHLNINYLIKNKLKYSILTPYFENPSLKRNYLFDFKYLNSGFKDLHHFIYNHCNGVIATDVDYHIPLRGHKKYLGLIPNPINIELIEYKPLKFSSKLKIFHGVNKHSMLKKGNKFFDEALKIIEQKYANKVEITTTYNIPYEEYIKYYDDCHILLDQVYAYDQGYNALEAMAKGKVVFTGAEQEWLDNYNLKEDTVAINALPDVDSIVKKLEWLILNPHKIIEISKNARAFIEKEHDYKKIANLYVKTWSL
ncbi:glycosyltransferase [Psychroserpens ponticola]|uniref:Glycosyltransferase n=1 Tax=Psychroserpens ponticola TaxID=2932268 RepID=A0ABY7RVV6_9FLAO|nr:glycosyltransferase [Psychroserpens ponticola]WCO00831.1 glycosyltransferase [Psychroserpens ponticola]